MLVQENDATCTRCGFTIEAADKRLGMPPMLAGLVSDTQGILSNGAKRSIERATWLLEQRFPQIKFATVIAQVPPDVPASVYAFWLFNRGSLSSPVEKGGENHRILLLIDTGAPRAAVTLGYGLEPFVSEEQLSASLRLANSALTNRHYADAIETFITELQRRLTIICQALPRIFGYSDEAAWIDATDAAEQTSSSVEAPGREF